MSERTTAGPRPTEPATQDAAVRPFQVTVPDEDLAELRRRLASARWPSKELVGDQSQGVQLATLQELARYWATDYDLRRIEARLNALPQFRTEIDGVDIHFLHVKSPHEDALPLLITHGWPGSVIELLEAVGPLTDPTTHGGRAEDAFDLVLPSLPGYGFSGEPTEVGWDPDRVARAWAELMRRLGHARYGSMLFVYLHILWFAVWILSGVEHYPYGLLTMIVSLEAIFLSTFVMISQNRADEKRQVLADHQWQTVQEEEQQNEELLALSNQILELTRAIHAMDTARSPTGRDDT
jgi:hypothetical protein